MVILELTFFILQVIGELENFFLENCISKHIKGPCTQKRPWNSKNVIELKKCPGTQKMS